MKIIDISLNKELLLPFQITLLDTDQEIKEKISLVYPDTTPPDAISFRKTNNIIHVSILLDVLLSYIYTVINNMSYIENLISQELSDEFNKLYSKFKQEFITLQKKTLFISVKIVISSLFPGIFDVDEDINQFKLETSLLKQNLINKYTNLPQIDETKINEFIDTKNHSFVYSILSSSVTMKISEEPLNSMKIIEQYELDNNVPFMYTTDAENKPIVKVYTHFSKTKIKEWLIDPAYRHEKDFYIKSPKGLTFKIKSSIFRNNDNIYSTVHMPKNSNRLTIRCSWDSTYHASFESISKCTGILNKFVSKIQSIFPSQQLLLSLLSINFTNTQIIIKKRINIPKLRVIIQKYYTSFEIDTSGENRKSTLKLIYNKQNHIFIRDTIIKQNGKLIKGNSIDILSCTNEEQLFTIVKLLVRIFIEADDAVIKDIMGKEYEIKNRIIDAPEVAVIKKLKKAGVVVDAVGCQKQRQVRFYTPSQKLLPKSYTIKYQGNEYYCPNPKYPFPGFTNKNVPCCFKKDQRKKEVFIKNMFQKEQIVLMPSDQTIIRNKIITTDKILKPFQLGVLVPDALSTVFPKNFYRLGASQIKNGFINAINLTRSISIDQLINSLNKQMFYSLENGLIVDDFDNYDDYIEYLKTSTSVSPQYTKNLIEDILNVNIIIFSVNSVNTETVSIVCSNTRYKYSDYIFILNINKNYELIVERKGYDLIKVFSNKMSIVDKIIDLYAKSCIVSISKSIMNKDQLLETKGIIVSGQVVDEFNKVVYLLTNYGLLPIAPSGIIYGTDFVSVKTSCLKLSNQWKLLENLEKLGVSYLTPVNVIGNKKATIGGIITVSGLIVPIKIDSISKIKNNNIEFIDYQDIDNVLKKVLESRDNMVKYITHFKWKQELYQRFRYTLAVLLNKNQGILAEIKQIIKKYYRNEQLELVSKIIKSLLDPVITFKAIKPIKQLPNKRNVCHELTAETCQNDMFCALEGNSNGKNTNKKKCLLAISKTEYSTIVKRLAIEIVTQNVKNEIITNSVPIEFLKTGNFFERPDEIILLTQQQLNDYFTK